VRLKTKEKERWKMSKLFHFKTKGAEQNLTHKNPRNFLGLYFENSGGMYDFYIKLKITKIDSRKNRNYK
jgi:hypothetical protein